MASAANLSTAQAETYAMLLSMGFEGTNAVEAARTFGSDVSSAVNLLTSDAPPAQAFYSAPSEQPFVATTTNTNINTNTTSSSIPQNRGRRQPISLDDIAIEEYLDRISTKMQLILEQDEVSDIASRFLSDINPTSEPQPQQPPKEQAAEFVPRSKDEIAFDEKTNENIKNITKRLSLTESQLQSQGMIGKAVWFGDVLSLREYPSVLMDCLDEHGNTALSLACRLGHDSVSHALLEMGVDSTVELASGWNVLQEAVLHRDARLVRDLLIHQIQLRGTQYEARNKEIIAHLHGMPEFSIEISWQITSSLAVLNSFIAKWAKIDNFKIWKKGTSVRFDMFMRGFSAQGVEKGHISFVFSESGIISIDHDRRTFTNAIRQYKNPNFEEMEREIRVLMRTEQGRSRLNTSSVSFETKKGWMGGDKTEMIEGFQCEVMCTKGLCHSIIEDKRGGGGGDNDGDEDVAVHQPQHKQGKKSRWQHPSFEEYFEGTHEPHPPDSQQDHANANDDQSHTKKRRFSLKKSGKKRKQFDAKFFPAYIHRKDQPVDVTLWLCQNYPLTDENIAVLLEAISIASEDMRKLADIFKLKFPGGFPVKLTIPIVVGISASATFCNFKRGGVSDDIFKIPSNYRLV